MIFPFLKVWFALKQYDNNLKKFSQIIDEFYEPIMMNDNNYTSRQIQNESPNLSTMNIRAIAESFIKDMEKSCRSSSSSSSSSMIENTIYAQVLSHLQRLVDSSKQTNQNLDDLKIESLHALLNMSLAISSKANINNTETVDDNVEDNKKQEEIDQQQNCLRILLEAVYFLFNQQYSKLFVETRQFGINANILNVANRPNNNVSTSFMLSPALRNVQSFLDTYKRKVLEAKSHLPWCDPQPPILCMLLFIYD